ncbi:redox protein [Synechococcus elongatus IITB7]|uniref:redox protein n=1 Tax=Synechococcus elongatus TaxID=32046 RepID=UPI0030CDC928
MYELISYERFRDTPSVRFFDVTVPESNIRDLVFHEGPAVSPNNDEQGNWQFYLHPNQEDNLLALTGGRTFFLVNFAWEQPFHVVRLEAGKEILRLPPGTFHRSVSDPDGSLVLNQGVRTAQASISSEFRVYNSADIPRLQRLLAQVQQPEETAPAIAPRAEVTELHSHSQYLAA